MMTQQSIVFGSQSAMSVFENQACSDA